MKTTLKTLMILAGVLQGTSAFADAKQVQDVTITISSGAGEYTVTADAIQCKGALKKNGSMSCKVKRETLKDIPGGRPLFLISNKEDTRCPVLIESQENQIQLGGGSKTHCFNASFKGTRINLP